MIDEIKAQRNRLLQAYHPDHNKSASANDMTRRINDAWETLSDPVRRQKYDEALKSKPDSDAIKHPESIRLRPRRRPHQRLRRTLDEQALEQARDLRAGMQGLSDSFQGLRDSFKELRERFEEEEKKKVRVLSVFMDSLGKEATVKFIEEYRVKTSRKNLFTAKQFKHEVQLQFPNLTFVRWLAHADEKTCDVCKALDRSTWVLEDSSPYPVRMIRKNSSKNDRMRFHREYLKRDGACRCTLEDVSDSVTEWFNNYLTLEMSTRMPEGTHVDSGIESAKVRSKALLPADSTARSRP